MLADKNSIHELYVKPTYVHNRIASPNWKIDTPKMVLHNLVYIYDGEGSFSCGENSCPVKAGDLVYFPPGKPQYMVTDKNSLIKLYTVTFHAALPHFSNGKWTIEAAEFNLPFINSLEDESVRHRFELLFERLCYLFPQSGAVQKGKQNGVLTEILALSELCRDNESISYSNRDKVNKAVRYMTENYNRKLSLKALAAEADLSPSYFSAVFREVTGKSPIDYLIHLRVFKAKQLLEDGFSVTRVAEETGFADIFYFSNVFKKLEGVSPAKYCEKRGIVK